MTLFVGIGEMKVSGDAEETLKAPNLGSCIGLAVFDPKRKVGGMIHCLLPSSHADPEKARLNPCLYVDTGVVRLLQGFVERGSSRKDLLIAAAGGAAINDAGGVFEIGKKNFTVLRKLLWQNDLLLKGAEIGGQLPRTLILSLGSGEISVQSGGELKRLV